MGSRVHHKNHHTGHHHNHHHHKGQAKNHSKDSDNSDDEGGDSDYDHGKTNDPESSLLQIKDIPEDTHMKIQLHTTDHRNDENVNNIKSTATLVQSVDQKSGLKQQTLGLDVDQAKPEPVDENHIFTFKEKLLFPFLQLSEVKGKTIAIIVGCSLGGIGLIILVVILVKKYQDFRVRRRIQRTQ